MPTDSENIEVRPEEKAPPPARLLPGRFPLLWVLLPLIAAYCVAESRIQIPDTLVWFVGALATCAALVAAFTGRTGAPSPAVANGPADLPGDISRQSSVSPATAGDGAPALPYARLWPVGFLPGVFSAGLLFHSLACPPAPDRAGFPPREAILSVRVDELFSSRHDAVSGVGIVAEAPAHLADLAGARIQFRVTKHERNPAFDLGATVRLRGILDNAPGGEGFARYLRQRGIPLTLSRAKLESVDAPASAFRQACTRARARVAEALAVGVDNDGATRLAALMLGRTGLLPQAERDDFQKAGATHLFAISGLHITGIAAGLLWASRRIRIPDAFAVPAVLAALWLYVQMAGAPPSAMRAWYMAAAMFGALILNRGARPFAGLVCAATFTLLIDPAALREPGFLLSYVVVAAILFYAVPAARELEKRIHPWSLVPPDALGWWRTKILDARRPVFAACATTFAATFAGAPLVAALFGNFSPVGLVANLAMVPLAAPPVIFGFLASVCGVVGFPALAAPFNAVGAHFMDWLATGANLAARVPGGSMKMSVVAPWAVTFAGVAALGALLVFPVRPDRSPWRYAILPGVVAGVFVVFLCLG